METVLLSNLEKLETHLKAVLESPDTPLDEKLFDGVELLITEENTTLVIPKLLPLLTQILPSYPRNPDLLASLSARLLRPIPFTQILSLAPEESLVLALQSPFPSATLLGISILSKASDAPSLVAILSTMKPVVSALIRTWLSSPDVSVGEAATKTLGDLLETDCNNGQISTGVKSTIENSNISPDAPRVQGLLWRRIFQDQDIYSLLFSLCSLKTIGIEEGGLDERQKTLAQARLLRLLPRLGILDFHTITHSYFPEIELLHGNRKPGLLYFAAVEMVNRNEDLLMHITLVNFVGEFLTAMSMIPLSPSTLAYLGALLKDIVPEDASMRKSLETTASDPETEPNLIDLLVRLKDFYE